MNTRPHNGTVNDAGMRLIPTNEYTAPAPRPEHTPAYDPFEWITLAQRKWGEGADHKKRDEAEAFIIQAVNSHQDLIDALEAILHPTNGQLDRPKDVRAFAESALLKAKGVK